MNDAVFYLAASSTASEGNPFFTIDPGIVLWVWIVFFVTLLILYLFAWKPILKVLDQREDRISKSLDNAKRIEEELRQTEEKVKQMILAAEKDAARSIEAARKEADELRDSIESQARKEAADLLSKAREAIISERNEAIASLRKEAGNLSVAIAEKILQENIDEQKNLKLAEKYLEKI